MDKVTLSHLTLQQVKAIGGRKDRNLYIYKLKEQIQHKSVVRVHYDDKNTINNMHGQPVKDMIQYW